MINADEDFKRMQNRKNLYIYGAKSIANIVYNFLAENQCTVKGFIVSRTLANPHCVKGLPVRLVYDMLPEKERICIIVAVLPRFRMEVVELLLQLGFCNIITLNDKYASELKRRLDEEQRVSWIADTEYELVIHEGIEKEHGILQRKGSPQSMRWRMDLRWIDHARQAAAAGAWKADGLTAEYERIYGRGEQIPGASAGRGAGSGNDSEGQESDIEKLANIYAIKCHVDKPVPHPIPYTYIREIQAGAALTQIRVCDCTDNTGDHISDKNRDFSECSAIYWIWKNGLKKEYTGIYHYRRYLDIDSEELQHQLEKGTTLINTVPCVMYPSNKYFFLTWYLYEYDWLLMMELIRKTKPEYYKTAQEFERGHFYLANNIFIMKTEWFDRMCEFVFGILLEIDRYYAERGFERQDRYAGFIFEVLYSIFVMHHAKEMKIAYAETVYLI